MSTKGTKDLKSMLVVALAKEAQPLVVALAKHVSLACKLV